jgi:general secretion pathway protein D
MLQKAILIFIFSIYLWAGNCTNRIFNISPTYLASSSSILSYFAKECKINFSFSNNITQKEFQKLKLIYPIQNQNILQVFDTLFTNNGFKYDFDEISNNVRIYKISTATLNLEYPSVIRSGNSNTTISLYDSQNEEKEKSIINSGAQISTNNKFDFWESIEKEIDNIQNRPEDEFKAPKPLINKYAGLVTITGTFSQIQRVKEYIRNIQSKLNRQVLLDISILNVTFNENNRTGIDWSHLQNPLSLSANIGYNQNIKNANDGRFQTISANIDMKNILNFLHSYGDVKTVSNPKIRTLNNQPAIISIGEQLYYKRQSSIVISGDKVTTTQNEIIESTFSGILIDIVPTINAQDEVILKINPSISSLKNLSSNSQNRSKDIPPDILKKQISTVVKLKDSQKIIIGGLIDTKTNTKKTYIPILGQIPFLGTLFSYSQDIKETNELVIIITPYIDNKYEIN